MMQNFKVWLARRLDQNGMLYLSLRSLKHPRESFKAMRRKFTKDSIFFEESELHMCSLYPEAVLRTMISMFKPQTVLDIGCGTGKSLDYFLSVGIEAQGVEGSALAISRANNPQKIQLCDLNRTLDLQKKFDLVWCFEVVEHIHPRYVHNLMETLTNHSDLIVISAAHPGQGGEGHFNEQPRSYWLKMFSQYNFKHDDEATEQIQEAWDWLPQNRDNLFVFRRVQPSMRQAI